MPDKAKPKGLDWPPGFNRTPDHERERGRFDTTEARCWAHIQDQVRLMNGADLVIETAKPHRKDGMPYAGAREPEDPGVIVRWRMQGRDYVIACDKYNQVRDNLRAIGLTLEAMRGIERWGAVTGEQAFKGLERLPPPTRETMQTAVRPRLPPHEVLGVAENAPPEVVKAAFKARVKTAHPERGGSDAEFKQVVEAKEAMLGDA